jgi:hypothetical protein
MELPAERLDSIGFQRALETDRGFYNDAAIDAAAKAVLLREWLPSRNMLHTYPKLNAMIVVSPKTLPLLAKREEWVQRDDVESMQRAFAESSSWVYAIRRFPSTYTFIIGGVSADDVSQGFRRLQNAKARFKGLLE